MKKSIFFRAQRAQNLLEYILIFAMVAIAGYFFVTRFDFTQIKNYVFNRPADAANPTRIKIESMTQ